MSIMTSAQFEVTPLAVTVERDGLSRAQELHKGEDTDVDQKVDDGTRASMNSAIQNKSLATVIPDDILHQILLQVDPETFASATLVCRSWRGATNNPKLYAYHLSRSPYYSRNKNIISGPFNQESLVLLKRQFVEEAKRCLFTPFLHPRKTVVSLMCESPLSSFAAAPGGEKFEFSFSQYARWCLAISSSRIYIIDLSVLEGVRVVKELKVMRRPLGADILANGQVLAVLSSDHRVSLYNVMADEVQLKRTLDLDSPPYTIAMSPGGEILASAFDGGIELVSIRQNALPFERRTVKCHKVDKLMFSTEGSMLLGTTQSRDPATVVLTAPYFSSAEFDLTPSELVNSMWTQQILFPSSSRDCSHSTLLPRSSDQESNWTLTYDRTYESFRAVRTDDLRNGTTYFTGPQTGGIDTRIAWPKDALLPSCLPSTTAKGDLVAAGFKGSEIWLYGVPEDLNASPTVKGLTTQLSGSANSRAGQPQDKLCNSSTGDETPPRWQMLIDKYRNVFSKGRKVADVPDVSSLSWFKANPDDQDTHQINERLIVAAPGGVGSDMTLDEEQPIDGGRLVIFDFGLYTDCDGTKEITIELGKQEPQLLDEQTLDMESEIAKAKRRTLLQRDTARVRSVLDALRPNNDLEDIPDVPEVAAPSGGPFDVHVPEVERTEISDDDNDGEPGITLEEAAQLTEGPYSNTDPRSRTALYRSATIGQATRQRVPQVRQENNRPQLRRQDGTELPDESDADNWVPPPPPYQRHAGELLPDNLVQRALLYSGIAPMPSTAESMVRPRRTSSFNDEYAHRRRSSADVDVLAHHLRPSSYQDSPWSRPGDSTAVSSTTVTPRSSMRRRPQTIYTSGSNALRDSSIPRSVSRLNHASSTGGASSPRMSRSESLRSGSQISAAGALGHSSIPTPLYERPNWTLPTAPEEQESASSPEDRTTETPPLARQVSPEQECDNTGPTKVYDFEELQEEPPASATVQEPLSFPALPAEHNHAVEEELRNERLLSGLQVPSPPQVREVHASTEAQELYAADVAQELPVSSSIHDLGQASLSLLSTGQLSELEEHPPSSASSQTARRSLITRNVHAPSTSEVAELEEHPARQTSSQSAHHGFIPEAIPASTAVQPSELEIRMPTRTTYRTAHDNFMPDSITASGSSQSSELENGTVSRTSSRSAQNKVVPGSDLMPSAMQLSELQISPPPGTSSHTHNHDFVPNSSLDAVPLPSLSQLDSLQNGPRPHVRRLSGSTHRSIMTPSPGPRSNTPLTAELSDNISIKSGASRTRRFSQRLRGALRRNEVEPMPELPIAHMIMDLGRQGQGPQLQQQQRQRQQQQQQGISRGPTRHSRMYGNARINASEPALSRPSPKGLGSALGRVGGQSQQSVLEHGVSEAGNGVGARPQQQRRRSIFGRRRKSQYGGEHAIPTEDVSPMPPMPPMPTMSGLRSVPSSVPGVRRTAITETEYGKGLGTDVEIAGHESRKLKKTGKDGKCVVM